MRTRYKTAPSNRFWLQACGLPVTALLASAAALGVAVPENAWAQAAAAATTSSNANATPAASTSEDEIIVTARRREERLQDVPVAITAVTGQQLNQLAISNLSDIARFVPGMVLGRQASGSAASIFLRGVGSSPLSAGFDQSVSFNLDGMAMSRGREVLLSQYDIQHVEVLKGPQALFFGKNTTGGLVSIVTRNPGSEFEANVRAGHGGYGEESYLDAVVSVPITSTFGARLAIHANNAEGWFDNAAQPHVDTLQEAIEPSGTFARSPTSDRSGANDSLSARLTLLYQPNSSFSLNFKAGDTTYHDNSATDLYERICGAGRTTPQPWVQPFFNNTPIAAPSADCSINGVGDHATMPQEVVTGPGRLRWGGDGTPYLDLNSRFAILNAQNDFDHVSLSSITSYYRYTQSDMNDFNGSPHAVTSPQHTEFEQTSEEARLETKFDGPFNAMLGAYISTSSLEFDTDAYIYAGPLDTVNETYVNFRRNDGFDGKTYSLFFEGRWNIIPTLELSAGARWSREEKNSYQESLPASSYFAATFPQNIRLDDRYREENVSPQATITWKPNTNLMLYAAYKEGFKAGGFNLSQALTPAASVAAGRFGSETATGWETGVRTTLFDRAVTLNATVYDYRFEGLQVQFFNPTTLGQVVSNAGALETKGVEGDFSWRVTPELSIQGAANYNRAEYDDFIGQCYSGQDEAHGYNQELANGVFNGQVYAGRIAPKAPLWTGSLGASYEVPISNTLTLTLSGDATHSSRYNLTDTLRPDGWQKAFTRFDASLALANNDRGWRLSLIGRNLTDELVATSANDMVGTGGTNTGATIASGKVGVPSDLNALVERGREVYVELGLDF